MCWDGSLHSPDARQECVIERLKSLLEEHESEISELKVRRESQHQIMSG